jgi:hypothetical protein
MQTKPAAAAIAAVSSSASRCCADARAVAAECPTASAQIEDLVALRKVAVFSCPLSMAGAGMTTGF